MAKIFTAGEQAVHIIDDETGARIDITADEWHQARKDFRTCGNGHIQVGRNVQRSPNGTVCCAPCKRAKRRAQDTHRAQRRKYYDARVKPFCVHGHAMTPENTYVHITTGQRACRVCQKIAQRKHRDKMLAANACAGKE